MASQVFIDTKFENAKIIKLNHEYPTPLIRDIGMDLIQL